MTVITKNLGEKKSDNLEEPLVDNIVLEHGNEAKKGDIEAGNYPLPTGTPLQTTRYIISARVRPYYSLMFILMLVLLVTTSLLGIFGTEYLYEQYKYLVGVEQKPEIYRAWGTLSFDEDPTAMAFNNKVPARFEKTEPMETDSLLSDLEGFIDSLKDLELNEDKISVLFQQTSSGSSETDIDIMGGSKEDSSSDRKKEIQEEFELDLDQDRYEKIDVPSAGNSRFVHDFYSNYTAIVDVLNKRCFIMPLDRSLILPPKSLYDLLFKMSGGYYTMDTEKILREMRVEEPPLSDLESFGLYIKKECQNFISYKLEKYVGGNKVVKRSASQGQLFTYYAGSKLVQLSVNGIPDKLGDVSGPRAQP